MQDCFGLVVLACITFTAMWMLLFELLNIFLPLLTTHQLHLSISYILSAFCKFSQGIGNKNNNKNESSDNPFVCVSRTGFKWQQEKKGIVSCCWTIKAEVVHALEDNIECRMQKTTSANFVARHWTLEWNARLLWLSCTCLLGIVGSVNDIAWIV